MDNMGVQKQTVVETIGRNRGNKNLKTLLRSENQYPSKQGNQFIRGRTWEYHY